MIDTIGRFRKKYTLALMMFFAGTGIAVYVGATLGEYTMFCGTLLAIFGAAYVAGKQYEGSLPK